MSTLPPDHSVVTPKIYQFIGGGGGLVVKLCPTFVTLQAPLSLGFPKQEY